MQGTGVTYTYLISNADHLSHLRSVLEEVQETAKMYVNKDVLPPPLKDSKPKATPPILRSEFGKLQRPTKRRHPASGRVGEGAAIKRKTLYVKLDVNADNSEYTV
jgi:hypothetical protein